MSKLFKYRIIILGKPGVGKTTLFNYLTNSKEKTFSKDGNDVNLICNTGLFIYNNLEVEIIDTPGLGGQVTEYDWWLKISQYNPFNLCIIILDTAIERISNQKQIYYLLSFIKENNINHLILGINDINLTFDKINYYYYINPTLSTNLITMNLNYINQKRKEIKNNCIDITDVQAISGYIVKNISNNSFNLLSPIEIIKKIKDLEENLDKLIIENGNKLTIIQNFKSNLRNKNNELDKLAVLYQECKNNVDKLDHIILENNEVIIKLNIRSNEFENELKETKKKLMDVTSLYNGYLTTTSNKIKSLLESLRNLKTKYENVYVNYYQIDDNNNRIPKQTSRWYHTLAWLPIAGNILLEQQIKDNERIQMKIKDVYDSTELIDKLLTEVMSVKQ